MYEESFKSGIKDLFFNAQGRFSRETFIIAYSALSLFAIIVSPLLYMLCGLLLPGFLTALITLAYAVYLLYAHFVVCIKRLHDLNLTGWLSILIFCFPLSFLFIAYLLIQKGRANSNKYGKPLSYTGPSSILNASYVFLILYAIFVGIYSYFFVKGIRSANAPNTGQSVQKVINALPKAYQKEMKKAPRSMGVLFIDNQFAGVAAPIAKDRVVVVGVNLKKTILAGLSAGKKVEIRFPDNSSANMKRLIAFNDSQKVQMSVFLIDPPIGTPVEMDEPDKKVLNEMNAFQ